MIIKNGLENAKNKLIYFDGENDEKSDKINQSLNKLLNFYTSSNTKKLTNLTDELMVENKKIMGNNEKYINIIKRTTDEYIDTSDKRKRQFEKIGE